MTTLGEVPLFAFHQQATHGLLSAVSPFRVDYISFRLVFVQKTGELTSNGAFQYGEEHELC